MLNELYIKNFAIIDDMQIKFGDGLTILSGETGAGKSIIINAVNLLLGARASAKLVRTGAEYAELAGSFEIEPKSGISEIMKENDYNSAEGLIIRRIISNKGNHKIYINDRPTSISFLTLLTENLASISGQHVHQQLLKEDMHLHILDRFGELDGLAEEMRSLFANLLYSVEKLNNLKKDKSMRAERIELLRFQQNEIKSANILPDEDKNLEKERIRLKNGEKLYKAVYESIEKLYSRQGAVVETLSQIEKNMEGATEIDEQLAEKTLKISDVKFHIEDMVSDMRDYLEKISMDEERLEEVESRLDLILKLKKKYGASIEAIFEKSKKIEKELDEKVNIEETIERKKKEVFEVYKKVSDTALALSEKRKKAAIELARRVEEELDSLKMKNTEFKIVLAPVATNRADEDPEDKKLYFSVKEKMLTANGLEKAAFKIAPNLGEELKPLAKIASGGELSRIVLALKAILAKSEDVGTVVFDEVDAGIGGGVAEVVGKKLVSLAKFHQLICITHLPQIAKFGKRHYKIEKNIKKGRTGTTIVELNKKERIKEIARMLGGEEITETTMAHAKEMLGYPPDNLP